MEKKPASEQEMFDLFSESEKNIDETFKGSEINFDRIEYQAPSETEIEEEARLQLAEYEASKLNSINSYDKSINSNLNKQTL